MSRVVTLCRRYEPGVVAVIPVFASNEREWHEGPPLGGSHASPRTHLRRGHIRQHPTAGRIWVNSCVVNPTAIGTVNKDYRIV